MKHPLRRTLLLLGGAMIAVVVGCSSSHPSSAPRHSSSHTKTSHGSISTAKPEPPGPPKPIPTSKTYKVTTQPGSSKGYVGATKDVKLSKCISSKTGTTFGGAVANPTGATQSYRIYVAVTDKKTTVGVDEVDVKSLAAKTTSQWNGSLGGGANGARCVLRVERTQT